MGGQSGRLLDQAAQAGAMEVGCRRDRERTVAGLAAARARGRKGGRQVKMNKADVLTKGSSNVAQYIMTKIEVANL